MPSIFLLSPMAAVYAALLSLARSLQEILNLERYVDPLHKEKIVSLHEKVDFLIAFLEDYSDKYRTTLDRVGDGIRKAAYEAQDFMDSYLYSVSTNNGSSCSEANFYKMSLDRNLNIAVERIDFISEEAMKMKNNDTAEGPRISKTYSSPIDHSTTSKIIAKNMVVGLDDDLNAIKERLYEDSATLQIIPIVGMGGIGKTTLARRAYEDSLRAQYFDFCAWITLSANYRSREILSGLLQYFKKPDAKEFDESEAHLATLVYQNLVGRRYLIVIDDIWSTKAWDDLKMIFPDDGNRSRILLTTRLLDVAVHSTSSSTPLHQMNFLNEDQSWKLLQERTFRRESCPLRLMEIGKKIARRCRGLPLTIVVVAGVLSMGNLTKQEVWENISENISSAEPTITLHCSKILDLSYASLPLRLKPCFLYIAAFPEDSEIDVSKLIKLWVAEGFLKPHDQSKCLEDVGEWYLEDLVNRSLILVSQKGPDGRLETIGIHDLLREICIKKAEEEGFLYHFSFKRNTRKDAIKNPIENPAGRLSIHYPSTFGELRTTNPIRSLLLFSNIFFAPRLSICCRNLNVLDAPAVHWSKFSNVISTSVNLRYIAFTLDTLPLTRFPASISKHPNLQTIIAHTIMNGLRIPYEVWGMPKLRHLIMNTSFHLSYPSDIGIVHGSDLQTLETVINFRFTEEAINMLMDLKKLKAEFDMYQHQWDDFNLNNLFRLQSLVELQVTMGGSSDPSMIWNHAFPVSLKKLSLHGVSFPWGNMTIIGSLPNLQVLEMINVRGNEVSEWKPTEGQFLRLKYFYSSLDHLVKWEVEKEHFSSLEILILMNVVLIHEIPLGIGQIDSLQLIELQHCQESLKNSAKQIQKQQHENGNDAFQVRFIVSDDFFHLKID